MFNTEGTKSYLRTTQGTECSWGKVLCLFPAASLKVPKVLFTLHHSSDRIPTQTVLHKQKMKFHNLLRIEKLSIKTKFCRLELKSLSSTPVSKSWILHLQLEEWCRPCLQRATRWSSFTHSIPDSRTRLSRLPNHHTAETQYWPYILTWGRYRSGRFFYCGKTLTYKSPIYNLMPHLILQFPPSD